jgi:hypothetical protein
VRPAWALELAEFSCFSCFTGTKVQILTQKARPEIPLFTTRSTAQHLRNIRCFSTRISHRLFYCSVQLALSPPLCSSEKNPTKKHPGVLVDFFGRDCVYCVFCVYCVYTHTHTYIYIYIYIYIYVYIYIYIYIYIGLKQHKTTRLNFYYSFCLHHLRHSDVATPISTRNNALIEP